jgi:hypothetical protein
MILSDFHVKKREYNFCDHIVELKENSSMMWLENIYTISHLGYIATSQ